MTAKDLRHPVKIARGLGSSQSGVRHWWSERTTSAALIPLGIWFVFLVLHSLHADYAAARAMVAKPWNALLLIVFLLTTFWHTVLGLQVVIEDYVHTHWKEVMLLLAIKSLAVLAAAASVLAVLRIALTP